MAQQNSRLLISHKLRCVKIFSTNGGSHEPPVLRDINTMTTESRSLDSRVLLTINVTIRTVVSEIARYLLGIHRIK